ncbi:MAG: ABC-F family ATP-binding cassette domain-containing protein [Porphyromonas sp.]|nr:ABC-F family ATP-binding cassette domain-containing protein [Porphyromonas sp.]
MALFQVEHLSKSFGVLHLFEDINFSVNKGQKVGVIAPNGSGKSTLLKIIAGKETADSGEVIFQKDIKVSYLPQVSHFEEYPDILSACMSGIRPEVKEVINKYERAVALGETDTITVLMDEMDALGAWDVEQELSRLLSILKIDNPLRETKGLSGGEAKRIAIASVLLGDPDVLILDEPTNHLDPDIIEWFEEHLSARNIALLMVTHDRYFLDKVCDTIIEMDQGVLFTYEGNYSKYLIKREERMEQLSKEQQSLRNLYKRELEWMRRMPQARATKAKYRKDAFYETESKLKNIQQAEGPRLEASSVYIGKKIFEAKALSKSFGDKEVIKSFTYNFARRDRVGIIGPNGAGKSTLIRLILGYLSPDSGSIEIGETVRFGYFAQTPPDFPSGKKVIEVITDKSEKIKLGNGTELSAMQLLTRFLFPPARQQEYVEKLSGGELRRLQLCSVLMDAPNFLVLDEPTNDLDIPTLQILEEYLRDFDGCILIVSHDRYFMDNLTNHLFVLKGDGLVMDFPGNYTEYRLQQKNESKPASNKEVTGSVSPNTQKEKGTREKTRRSFKEQQEFLALEKEIPELEARKQELQEKMSSGSYSGPEIQEMGSEYEMIQNKLDEKELRWLELSELSA